MEKFQHFLNRLEEMNVTTIKTGNEDDEFIKRNKNREGKKLLDSSMEEMDGSIVLTDTGMNYAYADGNKIILENINVIRHTVYSITMSKDELKLLKTLI